MKYFLFVFLGLVACSAPAPRPSGNTHVNLLPDRSRSQYEATGKEWVISTQGLQSTAAGAEILRQGGNLFDAFVAISFAISVERPHSTGIGGGGFVLFYQAREKKTYAFDFRETAPARADSKMFQDEKGQAVVDRSLTGGLAIATPGHVAGVLEMHKKYGRLKLSQVMAPAIRLAEMGFPVYPALFHATSEEKDRLARFPSSKKIFLSPAGEPWPVGHVLIQKDLGRTLRLISQKGAAAFYQGEVAKKIAASVRSVKGLLDQKDLAEYRPKWRDPVRGTYHGYEIFSQPPPSSGGAHVVEILNTVESDNLKKWGPQDPRSIHLTAAAMQNAFVDRAKYMGDPDFVKVPVEMLTSKSYAAQVRSEISLDHARRAEEIPTKAESPETTHFSLMDQSGNAIVSTQTINGYFGSALVAEGTGIMLNNEMDDFAAVVGGSNLFGAVGGKNNLVEPKKRPLSSMSPTLVLRDGRPVLALGTPSGTRIITCVAQTMLNVLEYNLPLWDAVSFTRYHHQWQPDQLQVEAPGFSPLTTTALRKLGYNVVQEDLGCRVEAIAWEQGTLRGVSDPREEGSSVGQ